MTKDKLLGVVANLGLPMNKMWARVLRRMILAGLVAAIAEMIVGVEGLVDPAYFPIITALGMGLDKYLRELLEISRDDNKVSPPQ